MRIRNKEIRAQRKRQDNRWKALHKGPIVGSARQAAAAAASANARPSRTGGSARPPRPAAAAPRHSETR